MNKKICFTIMGFGKKTDFSTGKTYDLDKTYQNIIKPAAEACGYLSVRADEIQDSGIIDKSMYALLVKADLVIADITTLNPNALYELGIRHAARPNCTVILKDREGKIPFDLDHNRFLIYSHLGDDVGATEAADCKARLEGIIKNIEKSPQIDSPLFEYLSGINPHALSQEDYEQVISHLSAKENHIFALSEKARLLMSKNDFSNAAAVWEKASEIAPDEHYFIQQTTLCIYKAELPSKESALVKAMSVISKIYDENETNDPETLGLVGAIHKRLHQCSPDIETLKLAIKAYSRGFTVSGNYYTGENYASCLDILAEVSTDGDEKAFCRYQAKQIRESIVHNLSKKILLNEHYPDKKWIYATMANCNFHLGNEDAGKEYEEKFLAESTAEWERDTYFRHKPAQTLLLSKA